MSIGGALSAKVLPAHQDSKEQSLQNTCYAVSHLQHGWQQVSTEGREGVTFCSPHKKSPRTHCGNVGSSLNYINHHSHLDSRKDKLPNFLGHSRQEILMLRKRASTSCGRAGLRKRSTESACLK